MVAEFDFLIGKTEAFAFEIVQEYGRVPRIVRRDEHNIPCTRDVNSQRVNLEVENNLVVRWYIG